MTGPSTAPNAPQVADDTGELVAMPPVDVDRNQILLFVGRKGSGKSVAARCYYGWWPEVDRLCLDVTGDADPGPATVIRGSGPPTKMPARDEQGEPVSLRYIGDPLSPSYREDLDRAVGMALFPQDRRSLIWIDELGALSQPNRTPPHLATLLQQSRHYRASAILCCPRPVTIDPLARNQADRIFMFDLPNPDDREAIAKSAGVELATLDHARAEARKLGRHAFVLIDPHEGEEGVYVCPPLPAEWLTIPADDGELEPTG